MLKRCTTILIAPLLILGCEDQAEVRVYESARPAAYNWPDTEQRPASHTETYQTPSGEREVTWVWDVPEGWVDAPEVSEFHIADYRFPGTTQALPGRMTVSVSRGDGGGVRENIQRWRGQLFIAPPQGPAPGDSVSRPMGLGVGEATIVELAGQYQGEHVPTHLLGAIVQIPANDGSTFQTWFFKMLGDRQTMNNNRKKMLRMLLSLRPEGAPAPELPEDLFDRALPGNNADTQPPPPPAPTPQPPANPLAPIDPAPTDDSP